MYVHTKACTWIFRVAFFLIASKLEATRCPSTGEWLNRWWNIHHPYHGILLRDKKEWNKLLIHGWIQRIMLSEKASSQKGHILHDSIYRAFYTWENYGGQINCHQRVRMRPLCVMAGLYQESQDLIHFHVSGKLKPISYWGGGNDCRGRRRPQFEQTAVFSWQQKGKQGSSWPLVKWSTWIGSLNRFSHWAQWGKHSAALPGPVSLRARQNKGTPILCCPDFQSSPQAACPGCALSF